jgi:hypothetical protein
LISGDLHYRADHNLSFPSINLYSSRIISSIERTLRSCLTALRPFRFNLNSKKSEKSHVKSCKTQNQFKIQTTPSPLEGEG